MLLSLQFILGVNCEQSRIDELNKSSKNATMAGIAIRADQIIQELSHDKYFENIFLTDPRSSSTTEDELYEQGSLKDFEEDKHSKSPQIIEIANNTPGNIIDRDQTPKIVEIDTSEIEPFTSTSKVLRAIHRKKTAPAPIKRKILLSSDRINKIGPHIYRKHDLPWFKIGILSLDALLALETVKLNPFRESIENYQIFARSILDNKNINFLETSNFIHEVSNTLSKMSINELDAVTFEELKAHFEYYDEEFEKLKMSITNNK